MSDTEKLIDSFKTMEIPPIPIRFPFKRSKGIFPRRIHNLHEDLLNPTPKTDWVPGDTCWFYDKKRQKIHYAVLTEVNPGEGVMSPDPHLFVRLIDGSEDSFLLEYEEAFASLEDLEKEFFRLEI